MTFGIKVSGVDKLVKTLNKIEKNMSDELERALKQGGSVVEREAKINAPYEGGNLRRSINIQTVKKTPTICEINIGTNMIYGRIQEFGGEIKAKNAPYLAFRTKDGKFHKVKSVTIPAHPYLTPAMDENHDEINAEVKYAMGTAMKRGV